MQPLSHYETSPKALILAADGRLSPIALEKDQVWSLSLNGPDRHPFQLETTYGLRAKSMRLFPNFSSKHIRGTEKSTYFQRPTVSYPMPSGLIINLSLNNGADILFECFMPEPDVLVGAVKITNTHDQFLSLTFELAAVLVPMGNGIHSRPDHQGFNQIITGQSENLWPVLFMTGGPTAISNPYPALSIPMRIEPSQTQKLSWALVTKNSRDTSLEAAINAVNSDWHQAMHVQVKKNLRQTLDIRTGNPDWDTAFSLAQVNAKTHLPDILLDDPDPRFIRTRLPDHQTATHPSSNYFNDLTTLEATHLAQILLPAQVNTLKSLVFSFLARTDGEGRLLVKTNTSAFLTPIKECPLLANLCLEIYEVNQDQDFLKSVFADLCLIFKHWVEQPQQPEEYRALCWESAQQCQLESGFLKFDTWTEFGQGLDIRLVESPALAAMLLRESQALTKIAEILGDHARKAHQNIQTEWLTASIDDYWQSKENRFAYRDFQTHLTPPQELYQAGLAQNKLKFNKKFTVPQRLQLHLISADERTRVCTITIRGTSPEGESVTEIIKTPNIRWVIGRAHVTTQNVFSKLQLITFEGLRPEDGYVLETVDLSQSDITCLLPLWSGGVNPEQIEAILQSDLTVNNADLKSGIPDINRSLKSLPESQPNQVNILWNTMIIEGLTRQNKTQEAAVLFGNLMLTICHGLKNYAGFYAFFNSDNLLPGETRNAVTGLPPVRLFLEIAGIRLFSPTRIALWGHNPFPEPVEVRWQGLFVHRKADHARVIFPDGTSFEGAINKPVLLSPGGKHE